MPVPSPALQQLVDGPSSWHTIEHHASIGSTNDRAMAALQDGVPPGLVVAADRQTAGRGRRGRTWEDRPDGASLAVSATVALPAEQPTLVPLVAGVALADALRRLGLRAALKWPNDVQLELSADEPPRPRRKVAGILTEAVTEGIVIGTGINVDFRGLEPVEGATSIAEVLGRDVDRWVVLAGYLRALDGWLRELATDGAERLLATYTQRCATLGSEVTATVAAGEVTGRAVAVGPAGALVLALADGTRTEVTSGEVHHVR